MSDHNLHNHPHRAANNIGVAFFVNVGFTILEIAAGFFTNSVAILSDAIHDLGDSFSLGMSWYLQKKSGKAATASFSYGYRRLSLLGALINWVILIAGGVWIVSEAIRRILKPEESDADGMILFAILGIAVNGYAAWKISRGKSMNERVLSWHLIEDVLGWVAILVVAIILKFWNNLYLDPALSILITAYILFNVARRLRDTVSLFLQGVPNEVNQHDVENALKAVSAVASIHHLHIWSLDGEHHVLSCHVRLVEVRDLEHLASINRDLAAALQSWDFEHWTLQTEVNNEPCLLESKDFPV